ncbi:MAG: S41 family peptidase [Flavobacteriales bacterium]|nr:S41 family peptidase [Flavobacteriales bacterium]
MTDQPKYSSATVLLPLLLAAVMAGGYFLGTLQEVTSVTNFSNEKQDLIKLNRVLNEIEVKYVDSISSDQLVETSIGGILQNLDPHSSYIPAKDLSNMDEPLKGGFGGIGIRFMILRDTLIVTNVIDGGPSERQGILPGDRIVKIDGNKITDIDLSNDDVFSQLKGQINTPVTITVYRFSRNQFVDFDILRGLVPIKSIESAQIIAPRVGFIKLARFAETTPVEFDMAVKKLINNGMEKLILDLRDNGGGYLQPAVQLTDQFLKKGKMIVYTDGRHNGRFDNISTQDGRLLDTELVVLINENSASASEIVSGAIQDNDRGIIMGRRSYGKGLVQEPIALSDGSAIRLTVARYYTPSGRCIQKPYGQGIDYSADYLDRYENGEFYSIDSTKLSELEQFKTVGGRIVYGGGGILPDVFIPLDTIGNSAFLAALTYSPVFSEFAFNYVDQNRKALNRNRNAQDFAMTFDISDKIFKQFIDFAQNTHDINPSNYGIKASKERIKTRLRIQIASNVWGDDGRYAVLVQRDPEIIRAIEEISK